jgi:hypothetical protein
MRNWKRFGVVAMVVVGVVCGAWLSGETPSERRAPRVHDAVMLVDANGYALGGAASTEPLRSATDYVCSGVYRMTITTTPCRMWDPNVVAQGAIPLNLVRLGIVLEAGTTANLHVAHDGNAYASNTTTAQWPAAGVASMPMRHCDANKVSVVSSSGTIYATLFVMTPR